MSVEADIKQQVRDFYNRIGWREVSDGVYQNARFEDLRPVAREYIHRCHMRVARYLKPAGSLFLDAGSGPIQYPEYLAYSRGYRARVCADISLVALQEARRRIGDRQAGGHGAFVVADIANLPFKSSIFEGITSLHTIHHLPADEHLRAFTELHRVLVPHCSAVVVNGWSDSPLMRPFYAPIRWVKRLRKKVQRMAKPVAPQVEIPEPQSGGIRKSTGTFVSKRDASWLKKEVGSRMPLEIRVWRSVSVGFLRTFIHPYLFGRWLLRMLFWLEERFPHLVGEIGQYPLIIIEAS